MIKTQKEQLLEKEQKLAEQAESVDKNRDLSRELNECKSKLIEADYKFEAFRKECELKLSGLSEQNAALQLNWDRSVKRCNDLNMELDEKGNLFQRQFQMFQQEFVVKEESLQNKLKLLQEDYLNLEIELENEKKSHKLLESDSGQLSTLKQQIDRLEQMKSELEKNYSDKEAKLVLKINEAGKTKN